MSTWLKDELRRIAGADDLHISPLREDGATYGTPAWILVRRRRGRRLRARVQRAELPLVSGGGAAEALPLASEGSHLRACGRSINDFIDDAYLEKVSEEPLSQPDDRPACPLRNSQGDAVRDHYLIRESTPGERE